MSSKVNVIAVPKVESLKNEDVIAFAPEVIAALLEFRHEKASGMIEVHLSQGGIAKVFSRVTKTYK